MKKTRILAVLNALCFLVHLVPAQLSQLRLFHGKTIGEVSDTYPTLFTPAGITFAIWGLIYLALAVFCMYHLVQAFRAGADHPANADLGRMGYLFILNNLATGAWTIAWLYEWLLVSVALMLVQLVTLVLLHLRLGIYDPARSPASRWCTQFPLSIYFGWICIATIANISATLAGLGWDGLGLPAAGWTVLLLAGATFLTVFLVLRRRNPWVGLVSAWAFYGIVLKHQQLAAGSGILLMAWIGMATVLLAASFQAYRNNHATSGN
jgi:hypothetical protein